MKFQRIQFTPDLLPADIVGTVIYNQARGEFVPKQGPIFANLVLADEINRAPAKVQSALLEAMQERQVTIGDTTYPLPEPFLVMATQNPIEQEGTYPLPEAQLDRFMLMIKVGYPTREEERAIMDRMTAPMNAERRARRDAAGDRRGAQRRAGDLHRREDPRLHRRRRARDARAEGARPDASWPTSSSYGASPRASIYLNLAARAHAFLRHRGYVTPEDVKAIGADVLRHRVILTYEAEAEEVTAETVVRKLFERVEVP